MSSKKKQGASSFAVRSLSRSLVVQLIYSHLLNAEDKYVLWDVLQEQEDYPQCDTVYCRRLLTGILDSFDALKSAILPFLDRPIHLVSPVELSIILSAVYELQFCDEVPGPVVLNEAIEQAKRFGSGDGHRYVNGVLDRYLNEKNKVK